MDSMMHGLRLLIELVNIKQIYGAPSVGSPRALRTLA